MATRNEYLREWRYADSKQRMLLPKIRRKLQRLPDKIDDVRHAFPPSYGRLNPRRVARLHREIEQWKQEGYWKNEDLAAKAQQLRRRLYINSQEAFNSMLYAAYTETYYDILEMVLPEYYEIAQKKHENIAKTLTNQAENVTITQYIDPYQDILPTGSTIAQGLYVEAAHRARIMARTVNIVYGEDDEEYRGVPRLITQEIQRAQNGLLRQSSGGGYHGILDNAMTFTMGFSALAAMVAGNALYRFNAIIDEVTTETCAALDGQIFKASEAVFGLNFPPIVIPPHFCRSWVSTELHDTTERDKIREQHKQAQLRKDYENSINSGKLSALVSFDDYSKAIGEFERKLLGLKTADGIEIKGWTKHFPERYFGSVEDKRSGVPLNKIIEALTTDANPTISKERNSQVYRTSGVKVSLNPTTNKLIQVSPQSMKRKRK